MQKILLAIATIVFSHYLLLRKRLNNRKRLVKPTGERVVILGCSSGIGKECALQYASRGAKLILFARRVNLLEDLQKQCEQKGASAVYYMTGDVTVENDLEKLASFTREKLQGVDTVIYCAGMISVRPFLESCGIQVDIKSKTVTERPTEKDALGQALDTITKINYYAAVWTARLFLPMLIESSAAPNYLVVSSMAGKVGAPTRSLYAGSKHALHGFFDSIRVELRPLGVHIGLICPGTVDTDLRQSAVDKSLGQGTISGSKKNKLSAGSVAHRIIQASDLREREIYIPSWFVTLDKAGFNGLQGLHKVVSSKCIHTGLADH
ncbi:hypothetical protein RMATCC62417_13611 [Rhizopus microsporus]|nr:hypothetical protein RMATCC62417_13611 [Rhizopus microsporus]